MNRISIHNRFFELFIPRSTVQKRISELASQIEQDYTDKQICFVSVLNGALFFTSDLILNINQNCILETVKCKSYEGMESSGEIDFELSFNSNINGRHIIFLEDIVDTGRTLDFLINEAKKFNPASIKVCSLLLKPEALQVKLPIDYVGFEIPNKFVVGYGLDYDGLGRNLSEIYSLAE